MASIHNHTARIYSLAYGADDKHRTQTLKVPPGMLCWTTLKSQGFNKGFGTEKEFEEAVLKLSKIDYVKVLQDLGRLTVSTKINTHLEEKVEEEKPKRKTRKKRKKIEEKDMFE